ncbi:MAG: DsbA family protein [Oscillatoriaceae bacterium SKW80]|nr:DsbA family protein [Oscillatoriaceae bacterium SKYG93]MCX8121281.1 DsbA family protein [Oscillatoriaceae bacterium SKW80]MDW8453385.1 DsbA family protein [Oscillatoriaceae cyanobacterium SKYGB_i_bin93]HIK26740.1 DsbA family protein [Oscillatoriaceae cyanobacterium M7585_C2015_266]
MRILKSGFGKIITGFLSTARAKWKKIHLFWLAGFLAISILTNSCTSANQAGKETPADLKEQVLQIIRENPQVIIESVQAYQQERQEKIQQAAQAFLQKMRTNPAEIIGDSPVTGAADKKIVLLEFSDFQCPFCAKAQETVKQFMNKHKDKVTLTYKHLPLISIHPQALPAAKAAWAAHQQGKFWEYQEALFAQQNKLGEELYEEIAKNLKLDIAKFNSDRQSNAASIAIQKDLQLAESIGIEGTPFFFLNDQSISGAVELTQMEKALERVIQSLKN